MKICQVTPGHLWMLLLTSFHDCSGHKVLMLFICIIDNKKRNNFVFSLKFRGSLKLDRGPVTRERSCWCKEGARGGGTHHSSRPRSPRCSASCRAPCGPAVRTPLPSTAVACSCRTRSTPGGRRRPSPAAPSRSTGCYAGTWSTSCRTPCDTHGEHL